MIANSPYQNYQQNAIMSASPEELTTMLYNRLIKDLKLALEAILNGNINNAHNLITHAQEIISHLINTLDTNYEVGKNLNIMYDYMYRRLVEANIKKDANIVIEVTGYAEEIRNTWVEAIKLVKSGVNAGG